MSKKEKKGDEPALKPKRLPFSLMRESDYFIRRYTAMIPVSHTLEDVERPGYFSDDMTLRKMVTAKKNGPVILDVISDDYAIHARYLVLHASKDEVNLRRMRVFHNEPTVKAA